MAKDNRYRSWAFILYEDSAPTNWREIIDDRHIRWCHSPYHDRDVNPTGEPKKPHYHIVLDFDGKKSFEQVKQIADSVNASMPIYLDSLYGYLRYLTHMDNPEKAQYKIDDIRSFGGFDFWDSLRPTTSRKYKYLLEMAEFIIESSVPSYYQFVKICASSHKDTWFPLLADKYTYFFIKLIDDISNGKDISYVDKLR